MERQDHYIIRDENESTARPRSTYPTIYSRLGARGVSAFEGAKTSNQNTLPTKPLLSVPNSRGLTLRPACAVEHKIPLSV